MLKFNIRGDTADAESSLGEKASNHLQSLTARLDVVESGIIDVSEQVIFFYCHS
jgi:hypothetical protein